MILVKVNGRTYNTYCGCDKRWDPKRAFCYGDRQCTVCGYFPWAASAKSMNILSEANVRRDVKLEVIK
jgi:hypothetical protein